MTILFHIVLWYHSIVSVSEAARILAVFPVPSISHQVVFRPLTQELAKRGHEVVIMTTDPVFQKQKVPSNLTEIDLHDISYKIWRETFMTTSKGNKEDLGEQVQVILDCFLKILDAQLNDKQVRKLLEDKSQSFDLVLTEACIRPATVFSHIYKVPVIQVSSFGAALDNYANIGAPVHPLLYPTVTHQKIYNLTIWEKITELYNHYKLENIYENNKVLEHKMLKKNFGNDVPTIDELNKNVNMLFLNVHPIFDGNRPVPPNVIFMGGLHKKPEKELPVDLKSYLDSSKNGVIYLSFGTNVDPSQLPPGKIEILVKTFSKLPFDVLWKWNEDELPGRTSNIKISKWLPQSDLLRHPKIKLFITQGGLQSTDEAITAGVPLIGIPMLGDQWYNVEKYVYHKIGIRLDMEMLSVEKLTKAIYAIIEDDSYRRNVIQLRKYMNDEPMRPLDRAVWWIEYVIRHGGTAHLRAPEAFSLSWAEYLEFELVFTILTILFAALVLFILILGIIYKIFLRNYICMKIKNA